MCFTTVLYYCTAVVVYRYAPISSQTCLVFAVYRRHTPILAPPLAIPSTWYTALSRHTNLFFPTPSRHTGTPTLLLPIYTCPEADAPEWTYRRTANDGEEPYGPRYYENIVAIRPFPSRVHFNCPQQGTHYIISASWIAKSRRQDRRSADKIVPEYAAFTFDTSQPRQ